MQNVSTIFKNQLYEDNRRYIKSCVITLVDGTVLNIKDSQIWDGGFKCQTAVSNTTTFDIGSAITGKFTLTLNNIYDDFSDYDFADAVVSDVKVGLELPDGTIESVKKGIFTVDEPTYNGSIITLECLDNMSAFDRPYSESNLTYPATLLAIVRDACTCCNVSLAADSVNFDNSDFVVQERPDDNSLTFREVLGYVGQISCHWCRCNVYGQLSLGWYDIDTYEKITLYDANTFDNPAIDIVDAGTFDNPETDIVDVGLFTDNRGFHHIYSLASINMNTDDVVITGIRVVVKNDDTSKEDVTYQAGTDGYVLSIEDNKLIQVDQGNNVVQYLGKRLIGLRFRPVTLSCLSDPTIEAGDIALISDQKGNTFFTLITDTTFQSGDYQSIECSAESPGRNRATRYSLETKTYQLIRKNIKKTKTEWQKAVEDLTNTLAASSGLYITVVAQEDGSNIYYMHNKKLLEDSDIVWKLTAEAFGISTDGGKTYPFGFKVTGEMITKILNSIGINADWINSGALTIQDPDGNIMFRADTATGRVDIVANSFQLRGKTLEEIAKESTKSYVDNVVGDAVKDVSNQYFGAYDPTLENKPASEWSDTSEKETHLDDIFYNTDTKKVFRFVKTDSKYSWENFDDPDVQNALDAASTAQDTADGKRRVFLTTPKPPYDEGDMWVTSTTDGAGEIKTCKTPRQSGAFSSDDWISPSYVDSDDIDNAINEYDTSLGQSEVFNKLTNNGKNKGIYIQNGELYVNASYILSGVLAGKLINGKGLNVTDKNGQVTLKIDDDGNVYIKATEFSLEGKNISDVVASESDKFRALNVILSNEYQGIPTDKDGKYTSFPSCSTTVKVLYGSEDVTKTSIIQWTPSSGVYGNASGETYTVTGLSTETGTVKVTVTRGSLTTEKIFKVAKQKQGNDGKDGTNGTNGKDGATGNGISSVTTYYLATSASSYVYTYTSGWTTSIQTPTADKPYLWSYQTTYYTDGTSNNTSPHIIGIRGKDGENGKDAGDLTQEQIFNILTNNGQTQGIYLQDGKVYINGSYIKAGTITASMLKITDLYAIGAKLGGWTVNSTYLQSSKGEIKLYASGKIQIGHATLTSESNALVIRKGLKIYCGTSNISDGTDRIQFYNLTHVTSGGHMVFASDGATVAYLASSSKRYKDHVSDMTIEEAEKILAIPVIWFKYKKGYLDPSDSLNDKKLPGFYAEDVYNIFPEATQLNEAGEPEDWNFRVIIPAMMKVIQNQNEKITVLEDTVNTLNERLNKIEEMLKGVVE